MKQIIDAECFDDVAQHSTLKYFPFSRKVENKESSVALRIFTINHRSEMRPLVLMIYNFSSLAKNERKVLKNEADKS